MPGTIRVSSDDGMFVVRFSGKYVDEDFEGYLDELKVLMDRGRNRVGMFVTERDARMPSHRHVWRQAQWMKENKDGMINTRKIAFVMPSALLRGALRAVFKLQPSPVDYAVFRDEGEALAWLRSEPATSAPS